MDLKLYFLSFLILHYSKALNETLWNLIIFVGSSNDISFLECHRIKCSQSFVPQMLYFLNESSLKNLDPLKRPFYLKSVNSINSYIVLQKLENILSISDNLERILTPKIYPMLFKDEEKVTFHVVDWNQDEIRVLLKSFGKTLKYKLVFSYQSLTERENLMVFGSCEFCKLNQELFTFKSQPEWTDYESNFGGLTLRVTTPTSGRPRLNYILSPDGKYQMIGGLLMYLLQYMEMKMNFTTVLKVAGRGGGTGVKLPNGTWNGVMSEILEGQADIGMCTAESYSRSLVAGFTPAVAVEPVIFVSGPPHKIFVWRAIFWPFCSEVWSFLAGTIICSVVMVRLSYSVFNFNQKKRWASGKVLEFIVGVLLENPSKTPKFLPVTIKFYVVIWLLCGSIITTAYISKLVGFLTFPQLEKVPETAEELVKSEYRWGLTYFGGALYTLIKGSKIKVYEKVLTKMELRSDTIGCLIQTLDTKYICISYEIISKFYLKTRTDIKQNPFTYSKNPFMTIPVGIVMEKRAVFGPNLKALVRSSDTVGLLSFWEKLDERKVRQSILAKKKQEDKQDVNKQDHADDKRSLTVQHMRGAFTVFVTGLILAQVVFSLEKIIRCVSFLFKNIK